VSVLEAEAREVLPPGRRVLRDERVRLIHPAVIRRSARHDKARSISLEEHRKTVLQLE
jgi:hypothetical protein